MTRDKGSRDNRWYLSIMAPNTKGNKFAWLDPTSIYINGEASMICSMISLPISMVSRLMSLQALMRWALCSALHSQHV